jgi:hypothetical protein
MRLYSRLQPEVLNQKDIAGYLCHLQLHNGRSGIGVMITVSNSDPLDYPVGVTDRGEDVNIGP